MQICTLKNKNHFNLQLYLVNNTGNFSTYCFQHKVFFRSFFSFLLSFLHLLTCVFIVWATSPLLPPTLSLALWFHWRENIRDIKKDIAFLLVWDKDSYTERFLALLPCTCVLQPTLVHLYQTSSLLPSSLPIVASASFKITIFAPL
jgi:hypothetical protein